MYRWMCAAESGSFNITPAIKVATIAGRCSRTNSCSHITKMTKFFLHNLIMNRQTSPYGHKKYKYLFAKNRLREHIRKWNGPDWHVGKDKAAKAKLFADTKVAMMAAYEKAFPHHKSIEQLVDMQDQDRTAEAGDDPCSVCMTNTKQVVRKCEHACCITCTVKLGNTCPLCRAVHTGVFVLCS
jgi:hypothetical protein